jgi:hypothetical protein
MANATFNKKVLKNAEETSSNLLRRPAPILPPLTRTGLMEPAAPPEETQGEIAGMGPITPLTPKPATAAGQPATASSSAAPDAGGISPELPPLDPRFLKAAEDTPEMAAFKAALNAPAPVFQKVAFTMAERVALSFLAGLKGIDAVAPIIEQRRREVSDVYQKAVEARGERLSGLFQTAQLSMAGQREARANAEQERTAKFEREKAAEQSRQFNVGQKEKAREFDLRQQELEESRAMRLQMRREPPLPAITEYNDTNSALTSIANIRTLLKAGRGGQGQMTAAAVGNAPGLNMLFGGTALVSENRELVAEMANLNSIFGPGRLGANIPAGEREIIEGVLRNPQSSSAGDVSRAVNIVERHMNPLREQLLRRYDFGTVSAPTDPDGLTSQMKLEIDQLTKQGFTYNYTNPRGHRVYQRGGQFAEVIPDAR